MFIKRDMRTGALQWDSSRTAAGFAARDMKCPNKLSTSSSVRPSCVAIVEITCKKSPSAEEKGVRGGDQEDKSGNLHIIIFTGSDNSSDNLYTTVPHPRNISITSFPGCPGITVDKLLLGWLLIKAPFLRDYVKSGHEDSCST